VEKSHYQGWSITSDHSWRECTLIPLDSGNNQRPWPKAEKLCYKIYIEGSYDEERKN
jgi:hypothetical protein